MSDKLVRDELLRSHRFQTLSGDAPKLLFVVLLLLSDHLSNAEATTTSISIAMRREISEEYATAMIEEMAAKDLVRPYVVDGKRYVHIPRSRQRIRYVHGRHPRPPASIEDKEISRLIAKVRRKSDSSLTFRFPKNQQVTTESQAQVRLKSAEVVLSSKALEKNVKEPTLRVGPLPSSPKIKNKVKSSPTPSRKKPAGGESATVETWKAYCRAYNERYGTDPVRNATVNGQLAQLVARVGVVEAPSVAAHYVTSQRGLYQSARHPTNLLLRDCEALRMEWATGKDAPR